jgi:hypothetical protein
MAHQTSRYPAIGVATDMDQPPLLVTNDRVLARLRIGRWSARSRRYAVDGAVQSR